MNKTLIETALAKFPKAKRIAVENFTSFGIAKMDMANRMNLEMDRASYNWNSHTVAAITYILNKNAGY